MRLTAESLRPILNFEFRNFECPWRPTAVAHLERLRLQFEKPLISLDCSIKVRLTSVSAFKIQNLISSAEK